MPRFNEAMNDLKNKEKDKPTPRMSKSEQEMADRERQIKIDAKVNQRINKLLTK